jgi:tryptophanyl-tRNA synthetase
MKKKLLSASVPTGVLTLGNYIGAIKNWAEMQEEYDCFYAVANLHAITTRQDPKELADRTYSFLAQYLACGLDHQKNVVFLQSQVPAHAELTWVLTCLASMGALQRMTQFKDKSKTNADNINAGLFSYPVLMAADILLYQASVVPVGEDQKQHLELTRDLAESFNNKFGKAFIVPEPIIPKVGARIMSLQEPDKKMSKSDANSNNFIGVLDDPKLIVKKIKSAVTDSGSEVKFREDSPGLANLLTIYSVLTKKTIPEIEAEFAGKMYGHLKIAVADAVVALLEPVQKRYKEFLSDKGELANILAKNASRARAVADKTLADVYDKVGFVR